MIGYQNTNNFDEWPIYLFFQISIPGVYYWKNVLNSSTPPLCASISFPLNARSHTLMYNTILFRYLEIQ